MAISRSITSADGPRLKVRGPAELIHAVPYLLGFHPSESLVVVGFAGGLVVVTARVDLADVVASQDRDGDVLAGTLSAMVNGGAEKFVGMVFDDRVGADAAAADRRLMPWHGIAAAFTDHVDRLGATVDDTMLIGAGRWWSYGCRNVECCPPEGSAVDEHGSAVAASAAFAGLVALPDRASVAELFAPEPDDVRAPLVPLLYADEVELRLRAIGTDSTRRPQAGSKRSKAQRGRASSRAAQQGNGVRGLPSDLPGLRRALFRAARRASPTDPLSARGATRDPDEGPARPVSLRQDEVVRFGAGLRILDLRDAAWIAVDDRRLDGRELWRWLGRRLPDPFAAAPLFLFGWASWRAGNGAMANLAAERALASDPGYTAADLLMAALSRGIDPRRMPALGRPWSA